MRRSTWRRRMEAAGYEETEPGRWERSWFAGTPGQPGYPYPPPSRWAPVPVPWWQRLVRWWRRSYQGTVRR